jgi:hypothetical protein
MPCARLKNVGQLCRATGLTLEPADAQALLFYCFIFGQSLLFLERGPRKRAQLIAKSAEKTAGRRSLSAAGGISSGRVSVDQAPFSLVLHWL